MTRERVSIKMQNQSNSFRFGDCFFHFLNSGKLNTDHYQVGILQKGKLCHAQDSTCFLKKQQNNGACCSLSVGYTIILTIVPILVLNTNLAKRSLQREELNI